MELINNIYEHHCNRTSDINEHLPTLKKYSEEVDSVVEMGVRWVVSTWALLAGKPKTMTSIDIDNPLKHNVSIEKVEKIAEEAGIPYKFVQGDTTKIEIEECDLLFIDTWHVYDQLKQELELHGNKARKYLIFHDTTTFGERGESAGYKGLQPAIDEFLEKNSHWSVKEVFTNNNGLLVLERDESSVH
jgi:hypothetical protein